MRDALFQVNINRYRIIELKNRKLSFSVVVMTLTSSLTDFIIISSKQFYHIEKKEMASKLAVCKKTKGCQTGLGSNEFTEPQQIKALRG